jgi:hypothetical protein
VRAPLALFLVALVGIPAYAADAPSAPGGWTRADDGTYTHTQSGATCPPAVGPYNLIQVDGPSEPGILGVCQYSAGPLRIGKIRVRTFIDGVGETPLAIQNDRSLMGVTPAQGVPPTGKLISSFRVGPGPVIDGTPTAQVVITSAINGLLVDCISQTAQDKAERDFGFSNFVQGCPPPK